MKKIAAFAVMMVLFCAPHVLAEDHFLLYAQLGCGKDVAKSDALEYYSKIKPGLKIEFEYRDDGDTISFELPREETGSDYTSYVTSYHLKFIENKLYEVDQEMFCNLQGNLPDGTSTAAYYHYLLLFDNDEKLLKEAFDLVSHEEDSDTNSLGVYSEYKISIYKDPESNRKFVHKYSSVSPSFNVDQQYKITLSIMDTELVPQDK